MILIILTSLAVHIRGINRIAVAAGCEPGDVIADIVTEMIERMTHGRLSSLAGRRIRAMAWASFSHRVVSTVSCFRPAAVSR